MSQNDRERKLDKFRKGRFSCLVATDVAARGLDIPNVDLVLHYELPKDTESFLHRYRSHSLRCDSGRNLTHHGATTPIKFLQQHLS